jgi:hypothetical protein
MTGLHTSPAEHVKPMLPSESRNKSVVHKTTLSTVQAQQEPPVVRRDSITLAPTGPSPFASTNKVSYMKDVNRAGTKKKVNFDLPAIAQASVVPAHTEEPRLL